MALGREAYVTKSSAGGQVKHRYTMSNVCINSFLSSHPNFPNAARRVRFFFFAGRAERGTLVGAPRAALVVAMPTAAARAASSQMGELVSIPSRAGPVPAIAYDGGNLPACGVIMCPGSSGGMGPGVSKMFRGLALDRRHSAQAHGSFYARLGAELSSGVDVDSWDPRRHAHRGASSRPNVRGSRGAARPFRVASVQMTWRRAVNGVKWPGGELRTVSALADAVDDVCAAAAYLRARHGPDLRVILVGFSFGGAVAWASARRLGEARVAGVVSLAGSARGGVRFETRQLDTESAVRAMANVPKLWVHGTEDANVAPAVTRRLFELAAEPKCAAWVVGSEHAFDVARGAAYEPLKQFLAQTAMTEYLHRVGCAPPFGTDEERSYTAVNCGAHVLVAPMFLNRRGDKENDTPGVAASFKAMARAFDTTLAHALSLSESRTSASNGRGAPALGRVVPAGLGAGWIDVSRAIGDGHRKAEEAMNSLVTSMSLEELRSPSVKGYSE